jgi:hypothetical protein
MAARVMGVRGRDPWPAPPRRSCWSGCCSVGSRWAGTGDGPAGTAMEGPGRAAIPAGATASAGAAASGDGGRIVAAIAPNVAAGTALTASADRGGTGDASMAGRAICVGGSGPLFAPGTRWGRDANCPAGASASREASASGDASCSGEASCSGGGASSSPQSSAVRMRCRRDSGSARGWVSPLPPPGLPVGTGRPSSGARRGRGGIWLSSATGQQLPVQDAAIITPR